MGYDVSIFMLWFVITVSRGCLIVIQHIHSFGIAYSRYVCAY